MIRILSFCTLIISILMIMILANCGAMIDSMIWPDDNMRSKPPPEGFAFLKNKPEFAIRRGLNDARLTRIERITTKSKRSAASLDTLDDVVEINNRRSFYDLYSFDAVVRNSYKIEVTGKCSNCASTSSDRALIKPLIYLLDSEGELINETKPSDLQIVKRNSKLGTEEQYHLMDTRQKLEGVINKAGKYYILVTADTFGYGNNFCYDQITLTYEHSDPRTVKIWFASDVVGKYRFYYELN